MNTLVDLTPVAKMAVIKWIRKNVGDCGAHEHAAISGTHATVSEEIAERIERRRSCGILFKCLFNNWGALAIHNDLSRAIIIDVTHRRLVRKFTPADLLSQPPLRVLGKRIHIVFAEAKFAVEHEFSLGRVLEPSAGEFERLQNLRIEQVDDSSAVHAVARQTVGMPGENSIRFTGLDTGQHRVENGSAGRLGRLLLNQLLDDDDALAVGKLAQFMELGVDGAHLFILHISGFASV